MSAVFSPDRVYRYELEREVNALGKGMVAFGMLNGSSLFMAVRIRRNDMPVRLRRVMEHETGQGRSWERAGSARQAYRPLRACCSGRSGRTARARPRRPSRAAFARFALDSLITRGANLTRNASATTNTEAMLTVCTRLASYARWSLITTWPYRPLRSGDTTVALDTSRARQSSVAQDARHGLNDDLAGPRRRPRRARESL